MWSLCDVTGLRAWDRNLVFIPHQFLLPTRLVCILESTQQETRLVLAYIYPVMCSFLQLKLPWILMPLTGQAMNLPGIHLSWKDQALGEGICRAKMHTAERYKLEQLFLLRKDLSKCSSDPNSAREREKLFDMQWFLAQSCGVMCD